MARPGPRRVQGRPALPVPPLPGARHTVVAATIGAKPEGLHATWAGDGLVGHPSACAMELLELEADDVVHLARTTHFRLLNHPQVHAILASWATHERPTGLPRPRR